MPNQVCTLGNIPSARKRNFLTKSAASLSIANTRVPRFAGDFEKGIDFKGKFVLFEIVSCVHWSSTKKHTMKICIGVSAGISSHF
jgi:hypothetical protein